MMLLNEPDRPYLATSNK